MSAFNPSNSISDFPVATAQQPQLKVEDLIVCLPSKKTQSFLSDLQQQMPILSDQKSNDRKGYRIAEYQIRELKGGKKTVHINENGDRYEGSFFGGTLTGKGTLYLSDGKEYRGPFLEGKPHGLGTIFFPDGTYYEGNFMNGEMTGSGKVFYGNGNIYAGNLQNGKRHGEGSMHYVDGSYYIGSYLDGKMSGKGMLHYKDGSRYMGSFQNGAPHGQGVYEFHNGNRYQGGVKYGLFEGKGGLYFPNGDVYTGDFSKGMFNGYGKFVFADDTKYEGSFWNGDRHGSGIFFNKDGFGIKGNWFKNQLSYLDRSYLAHPFFLSSLLDKNEFPSHMGVISIFHDYFKKKPQYSSIAEALLYALSPGSSHQIYARLLRRNKKRPQLISLQIKDHAALLQIRPTKNNLLFKIFNSGIGLNPWHDKSSHADTRFQTALEIRVPKESVTVETIKRLFEPFEHVDEPYEFLYSLERAQKVDVQDPIWQKEQKGSNCSIESVFAFLKNVLGEEQYHCMRMEFFDDCIEAVKASPDQQSHLFLNQLENKKMKRAEKHAKKNSFSSEAHEKKET